MTKENAKDYLPLVQALSEGKTIQFRRNGSKWLEYADVAFDAEAFCYRIKPDPIDEWIGTLSSCLNSSNCLDVVTVAGIPIHKHILKDLITSYLAYTNRSQ